LKYFSTVLLVLLLLDTAVATFVDDAMFILSIKIVVKFSSGLLQIQMCDML
jgi:hypothetical protein